MSKNRSKQRRKEEMSWHYQVCKIVPKKGSFYVPYFAIREIYVSKGKKGISYTEDNIAPKGDTKLEVIEILTTMLKDACYYKSRIIKEQK